MKWSLQLLGGFRLSRNAEVVDLHGRKDRLLLGFLALQRTRLVSRDKVAGLLWADRAEDQARGSLRQSLAALRGAFGQDAGALLITSRETICLQQSVLRVDVQEFEEAAVFEGTLLEAPLLYQGPLLDGFDAPTPEYGEWLLLERQRLEDLAASVVEHLAAGDAQVEESDPAISLARQLLSRDRVREPLYQALMKLYVRKNRRTDAAKVYNECQIALMEELGVKPTDETTKLFADIIQTPPNPETHLAKPQFCAPVTERPSIAVLPFHNLSQDAGLTIVCEGLAEDITSGLGRFGVFDVIDRFSSAEIAKSVSDTKEIGRRLDADLVIQGSLQPLQNALRLTVKLVEAATRIQKWTGQFTLSADDILNAPDRIMAAVLPSISAKIETTLIERSRRKPTLAAYEHLLLGVKHLRGYQPDDNKIAIDHFDKALASDPTFALAMAYRGFADIVFHGYDSTPKAIMDSAIYRIRMACDIDPYEPRIWWLLGMAAAYGGDIEEEEICYSKSVALNPSDANALTALAMVLILRGERESGLAMFKEAFRLNPYHPEWYWIDFGSSLYVCERYEEAIEAYAHRRYPGIWVLCRLAACYAQLDRMVEARSTVKAIMEINPGFRLSQQRAGSWGSDDTARFRAGMLKAGLPE